MLSEKELKKIARKFITESVKIGRKPNPNIPKAKKKFGKVINKFLKMKKFTKKQLTKEELEIAEKLKDPKYGPLIVEWKGKYYVKTEVGQTIRLMYSNADEECIRLANYIKEECWKRGAHVSDITFSSAESRKHMQLIPFDTAAELSEIAKFLAGAYDFRLFLGGEEDINWIKGLEEKVKLGAPATQKIREIIDRKNIAWCYFGWPVKRPRKQLLLPEKKHRKIFYDSIKATFTPFVKRLCAHYKKVLMNVDKIKITANDGTNLTFSIKGRPVKVADGIIDEEDRKKGDTGLNIPDGEVYFAPLEYSANGYIVFDYVTIHGYGLIKNLKLKFKNGKVIWYDASENGKKIFKKFLDSNTGEKDRIAEFAIGTNPKARFVGDTIIDEKIFGTIHIAIGSNIGKSYGGKNKASSHQDMIKIMRGKQGRVYADGKLIMNNGLPVGFKWK